MCLAFSTPNLELFDAPSWPYVQAAAGYNVINLFVTSKHFQSIFNLYLLTYKIKCVLSEWIAKGVKFPRSDWYSALMIEDKSYLAHVNAFYFHSRIYGSYLCFFASSPMTVNQNDADLSVSERAHEGERRDVTKGKCNNYSG